MIPCVILVIFIVLAICLLIFYRRSGRRKQKGGYCNVILEDGRICSIDITPVLPKDAIVFPNLMVAMPGTIVQDGVTPAGLESLSVTSIVNPDYSIMEPADRPLGYLAPTWHNWKVHDVNVSLFTFIDPDENIPTGFDLPVYGDIANFLIRVAYNPLPILLKALGGNIDGFNEAGTFIECVTINNAGTKAYIDYIRHALGHSTGNQLIIDAREFYKAAGMDDNKINAIYAIQREMLKTGQWGDVVRISQGNTDKYKYTGNQADVPTYTNKRRQFSMKNRDDSFGFEHRYWFNWIFNGYAMLHTLLQNKDGMYTIRIVNNGINAKTGECDNRFSPDGRVIDRRYYAKPTAPGKADISTNSADKWITECMLWWWVKREGFELTNSCRIAIAHNIIVSYLVNIGANCVMTTAHNSSLSDMELLEYRDQHYN